MDPFASHVLRALLVLLCPALLHVSAGDADKSASSDTQASLLRSKKSAKYRAKQGPMMRSVFVNGDSGSPETSGEKKGKEREKGGGGEGGDVYPYPVEFGDVARELVESVRKGMNGNEIRALAASKVACPVLVVSEVSFAFSS